jgi:antitoxin component of MazEF toxin-antitoxin module
MESNVIEIGTRKLQKIGGAHQMTIPPTAITMMQLKAGDMMTCYLDGNTLLIRKG